MCQENSLIPKELKYDIIDHAFVMQIYKSYIAYRVVAEIEWILGHVTVMWL